ncbi:MAG: asparagine synthase (glutamine-hydrolyzing) [Planctomycetes bacterium]|nr:asparagine synthase (glutamine-hydrolyzing) [Planctomycetota bacterium]
MCGICGVYDPGLFAPAANAMQVARMRRSLVLRGPDDEGSYGDGERAWLGHRRLSILDVKGGHQPMSNEDGKVWVSYNGEVYNHADLRRELEAKGHVFRTRTDTETLVHGFEEWGEELFGRLNGIFALALYDERAKRLVLARDPLGVKPLYYWEHHGRIAFASEIKALFADRELSPAVDEEALDLYLAFRYVPSPRTLFKRILRLPPGHLLIADYEGARTKRWWRSGPPIEQPAGMELLSREFEERLRAAVRRQMMSDVPVGSLLSGGLDSALVTRFMQEESPDSIRTFTVGFRDEPEANECEAARETAALLGTQHREVLISRQEYLDFFPESIRLLEEPISSSSALALHFVCRAARADVKVLLCGQGADEPLAGYGRYLGEYYGGAYRLLPRWLREGVVRPLVEATTRRESLRRAVRSLGEADPLRRFLAIYSVLPEERRRALLGPDVRAAVPEGGPAGVLRPFQEEVRELDGVAQLTRIDTRLWLPDDLLLYGDKMSMAASVELRVPFLDLEFLRFAESIPSAYKIRWFRGKAVERRAARRLLPGRILRRAKQGFRTPIDGWFRAGLKEFVSDALLGESAACRSYFDPEGVASLVREHAEGREDHHRILFALLSFELWHGQFVKNRPAIALDPAS